MPKGKQTNGYDVVPHLAKSEADPGFAWSRREEVREAPVKVYTRGEVLELVLEGTHFHEPRPATPMPPDDFGRGGMSGGDLTDLGLEVEDGFFSYED